MPLRFGVTVHDVVDAAHRAKVAIRNGNMYAVRLCEDLGGAVSSFSNAV